METASSLVADDVDGFSLFVIHFGRGEADRIRDPCVDVENNWFGHFVFCFGLVVCFGL
jgi:hypothetical protein